MWHNQAVNVKPQTIKYTRSRHAKVLKNKASKRVERGKEENLMEQR